MSTSLSSLAEVYAIFPETPPPPSEMEVAWISSSFDARMVTLRPASSSVPAATVAVVGESPMSSVVTAFDTSIPPPPEVLAVASA
jgi:hypothetical protein